MILNIRALAAAGMLVTAAGSAASAADLPPAYDAPPGYDASTAPRPAAEIWQGVSIGLLGAYGIGSGKMDGSSATNTGGGDIKDVDPNGPMIGGLAGIHGQVNNLVFGAEIDGSFSTLNAKVKPISEPWMGSDFKVEIAEIHHKAKIDSFLTARARLGYAVDNVLLYGTGGVALAHATFASKLKLGAATIKQEVSGMGFTPVVGGGLEYKFDNNVSIRSEYLYAMPFDVAMKATKKDAQGKEVERKGKVKFDGTNLVRVGLSYNLPMF